MTSPPKLASRGGVGEGTAVPATDHTLLGQRRSAWAWLVTASALVVVVAVVATAAWWAVTRRERVTTYSVRGTLAGISLDLGSADAEIVGGRDVPVVDVRRSERYAFGQPATNRREVVGGVLRIRARCPDTVLATCSASYKVTVPNNVPVTVRTGSGDVALTGLRGSARITTGTGDIAASSYCGFVLQARAESGDVAASAACAPERLDLRSRSGGVRAVVPPGRYRIDADSDEGTRTVRGLTPADDAPFQLQVLSDTGDVALEAGP
jgi:hypothetical protein